MTITITEQNDHGEIQAHAGDILDVNLSENATTGYRWELDNLDPHLFEPAGSDASYPGRSVGSGGTAHFIVKLPTAGKGTFRAKYWRSWEGEGGIIQRFSVEINVT